MKGPSGRLKFPIRRMWRCPACGRTEWTTGKVVTKACRCTSPEAERPIWMALVEEPSPSKPRDETSPPPGP